MTELIINYIHLTILPEVVSQLKVTVLLHINIENIKHNIEIDLVSIVSFVKRPNKKKLMKINWESFYKA